MQALGRLAKKSPEESRRLAKTLWENSSVGSPLPVSGRDAASDLRRGLPFETPTSQNVTNTSPGPAVSSRVPNSQVEVVNVVETMADTFKESLEAILGAMKDKDEEQYDKPQSIHQANFDFKRPTPTIRDDDLNLDRYDRDFDIAIQCWEYGGRKMKEITKLYIYGNGFPEGSTRRRVFENYLRKQATLGRIPEKAKEIMVEVRAELRLFLNETKLQKQSRLDKEFRELEQGALTYADFRSLWDGKIQDMEDAQMDMPTPQTLFRYHLQKLNSELRIKVQSKDYRIDGADNPPRCLLYTSPSPRDQRGSRMPSSA